jgi:hypothetical protein
MEGQLSREVKRKLLILCLIGFAFYGILNMFAMIFYPGGTSSDAEKTGYSFLENFFSDLGMVRTYTPKGVHLFWDDMHCCAGGGSLHIKSRQHWRPGGLTPAYTGRGCAPRVSGGILSKWSRAGAF